ncbi:Spore germination GerAC [Moorella glycerini]|uniref:Spore germination protein B3 n=1 Tax=Neomoorella stamsii TaxID=1266720 RepID=A0A9X7P6A9_9FIRM|nr:MULTISPECIES: Ger(x)C family spore germination protein [Moorella]PRR72813.1 Spore germination protein B3 precursor [Moorella stamsii]CEP66250.1 Spore germination GerAC [Moorella glycerini]CEP68158.1 Spore germination GerAC [Moorella glycerini]
MVSKAGCNYFLYVTLGLVALLMALFLSGCWDRREINELAFLSSMAVDLAGEQRILTYEFVRPGATGGGERGGGGTLPHRQATLRSGRGETLISACRQITTGLPRRVYLAHTNAVLVGEEMARQGLRELLDFIDRHPELRRTTLIMLTRGPSREVLIKAQGDIETTLGKEISGLRKWVQSSGYGFIPNVNDVFFDLTNGAGTTVLPVLELSPQPFPPLIGTGASSSSGGSRETGGTTGRVEEPRTVRTVRLNGAGIFYHDKLVEWLDKYQARGWAWVRNKVRRAVLALRCQENNTKVAVDITEAHADVSVDMQGGQLQGKIKLRVEGELLEQQCNLDFTREEAIKSLESQMAARITAEISSALNQAKMVGTDVFGFGSALHRQQPELWRQLQGRWNEEFKKLPVTINVEAKLRRTGMTGRPWQPGAR